MVKALFNSWQKQQLHTPLTSHLSKLPEDSCKAINNSSEIGIVTFYAFLLKSRSGRWYCTFPW